jgi:hypothetical protein
VKSATGSALRAVERVFFGRAICVRLARIVAHAKVEGDG